MTAVPTCPVAGLIVTVRFNPLPPNTMLPLGTTAVLSEVALRVNPAGPTLPRVNGIAPVGVFSGIVWSGIAPSAGVKTRYRSSKKAASLPFGL